MHRRVTQTMPAASNKTDLLAVTEKEFRKLDALLETVSASVASSEDDDDTSIKDIIAHRAHWIGLFFGWYEDGRAGRDVDFPAKGYKWNELKAYNAMLRDKYKKLSWVAAQRMLRERHQMLVEFIESRKNAELYGGPMKGANNAWTTGRWAEASGASHYRSAAKYVRQRIKQLA